MRRSAYFHHWKPGSSVDQSVAIGVVQVLHALDSGKLSVRSPGDRQVAALRSVLAAFGTEVLSQTIAPLRCLSSAAVDDPHDVVERFENVVYRHIISTATMTSLCVKGVLAVRMLKELSADGSRIAHC